MLDLAAGIEVRNYGLRRAGDPRSLLESLKMIFPLAMVAGALSFYVWVRGQVIQVGYQSQRLKAQEEELLQTKQHLVLEEQTLKDPRWLEAAARKNLNMAALEPCQVIPAPLFESWDTSSYKTPGPKKLFEPMEPEKPTALN